MKEKQLQYYLVENFSDILYQGFNRILERNSLEELGFETCVDYCSYYGPVLEITDSEFFEAQNDQIEIHFQVTAELTLMLADYYLVPTSVTSQSFGVICKATPEKEFQDFQVCSIYPNSIPNVDSKKLSDQLIPIIYEENLEDEAQHILETYYPEALETPNPIDMRDFTSRLGLEVLQAAYGEASSVLGKIYFEDSDLKVRCGACQSALFHVPRGTIVLDPTNPHLRNEGSRRFTIMHECIH